MVDLNIEAIFLKVSYDKIDALKTLRIGVSANKYPFTLFADLRIGKIILSSKCQIE